MKLQFPTLAEQISFQQEKHKISYNRIQGVVDRLIDLYEKAEQNILTGKDHRLVIEQLNNQLLTLKPFKTVREHFVHYYRKLANLSRKIHNDSRSSNAALSKYSKKRESNGNHNQPMSLERFNSFFDTFITEQSQKKALQKLVVQHFLREGRFQCARVWGNIQNEIDPNQLFNECSKLKTAILRGDFDEAISWCENQKLFESHKNYLEYELIKAQIMCKLEKGEGKAALAIFSKKMGKFIQQFSAEIQKLVGYIMYRQNSFWGNALKDLAELSSYCKQRYAQFMPTEEKLTKLSVSFQKSYLKQYDISPFDVLKIVYESGCKKSSDYMRLMNLMWLSEGKKEQGSTYNQILPFSVKLQKDYTYHSLFLCPVTKEVHSGGQTSIMLSCGHLISQTAQERIIQESRNRRRVKCPVCQKEIKPQDSIAVEF